MKMMKSLKVVFGILVIVLVISACQTEEKETSSPTNDDISEDRVVLEEKPTIILQTNSKDLAIETVLECWAENCNEGTATSMEDTSIENETEGIPSTVVLSGTEIKVEFEGSQPERLSYRMKEDSRVVSEYLEDQVIEVYGEGKQHYLLSAEWRTEEGKFQGSKTIGFVLDVEKEKGKEVKEVELKDTTFTHKGESYPAEYHVNCLNETACEAPPTNAIDPYSEWKDEVNPAEVNANIGDEVKIAFPEDVPAPKRLSIHKQQGATGVQEYLQDNVIEIMGEENTKITYIVHAEWSEKGKKTADVQFAFIVPRPSLAE
ncbi:hypothetical protein DXT76_19310 [Halobacillus trueperi]|uniref:Uncharacterized protein n=1 Tax=Halobacillus trueperi TaxID=156205 RepID=A0A3D8VE30_9BACI|nr:hypothetical protein [Halobacillus trueperi]RDY67674.1 hypothetical protein DXT76_19310 [Halobacillus trueperi]